MFDEHSIAGIFTESFEIFIQNFGENEGIATLLHTLLRFSTLYAKRSSTYLAVYALHYLQKVA